MVQLNTILTGLKSVGGANAMTALLATASGGLALSHLRIHGTSVGIAAVMFTGLALGMFFGEAAVPPDVFGTMGLAVFVYMLGLRAGPSFLSALRRRGLQFVCMMLPAFALGSLCLFFVSGHGPFKVPFAVAGGVFAGALSNATALASFSETLERVMGSLGHHDAASVGSLALIGYAIAYPVGLTISILSVRFLLRKHTPEDFRKESSESIRATQGSSGLIEIQQAGLDPSMFTSRRILVSSRDCLGKTLAELDLPGRFQAYATRLRRGDVDMDAQPHLVLEPGDRIRVVVPRERLKEVNVFLGDSIEALREWDYLPSVFGLFVGILVGQIPIGTGNFKFTLGMSAGPLLVGIVLGHVRKTGNLFWQMPPAASAVLKQWGLIVFLACAGLKAGSRLEQALAEYSLSIVVLTVLTSLVFLALFTFIGKRLFRLPADELTGSLAGAQTDSAVQEGAYELTRSQETLLAYTAAYPAAMVFKILFAQLFVLGWYFLQ